MSHSRPSRRTRGEAGAGAVRNVLVTLVSVGLVMGVAVYGPSLLPDSLLPSLTAPVRPAPVEVPPVTGGAPQVTVGDGEGTYRFAATQPGDRRSPVSYAACSRVPVVVNLDGAPEPVADLRLVLDGLERISDVTGLDLDYVGTSAQRPSWDGARQRLDPDDVADPDPVLVSFADVEEVPQLQGDVAGLAGSVVVREGSRSRYLTGQVTLDRDSFADLHSRPGGEEIAAAIVVHELAHLVGLDHVDDRRELMYATTTDQRDLGVGDLAGLRRLGGRCAG